MFEVSSTVYIHYAFDFSSLRDTLAGIALTLATSDFQSPCEDQHQQHVSESSDTHRYGAFYGW